jgi:competence protein ComEC
MLLIGPVAPSAARVPQAGGMRVTLLAVGAGQCAVVEAAGAGPVVIDAGSSSMSDAFRNVIGPFLRHERRASVEEVWLSHGDFDHISAVALLVPAYGVQKVFTSPHFRKHAAESTPCEELLSMLDHSGRAPRLVVRGNRVLVGRCAQIEVLWPPAQCGFNSNNAGLVLRLTCAGRSILFPADIQEPAERELLKHSEKLKSDVLVAPHHGSAEATTAAFIRAVSPSVILSSDDARLTMKQRLFDAQTTSQSVYRTSHYGALTLEIAPDGDLKVLPYRAAK